MREYALFFVVTFIILGILALAFWIWMLVDVIKRQEGSKLFGWLIVVLFLGLLGALIYYFLGRQQSKRRPLKKMPSSVQTAPVKTVKDMPVKRTKTAKKKTKAK